MTAPTYVTAISDGAPPVLLDGEYLLNAQTDAAGPHATRWPKIWRVGRSYRLFTAFLVARRTLPLAAFFAVRFAGAGTAGIIIPFGRACLG